MPVTYLVLRVLHIVAGTLWTGAAVLLAWFVEPAVRAAGPAGGAVMQQLVGPRRLSVFMSVSSLVATVTGVWLYWPVSGHVDPAWLLSRSGLALTIGSAAGVAAFFIGMLINAPAAGRLGTIGAAIQASGTAPTAEQQAELARLRGRLEFGTHAGAIVLLVATLGMAAAKYLF